MKRTQQQEQPERRIVDRQSYALHAVALPSREERARIRAILRARAGLV